MTNLSFHLDLKIHHVNSYNKHGHFIYHEIYEDTKKKLLELWTKDPSLVDKLNKSLSINDLHRKIIRPVKESEIIKIEFAIEKIIDNKITFLLEMFDAENNLLVFSRITEKVNKNNMDVFKSILTKITKLTHEK